MGTPNEATSFRKLSSNNIPVGFIGELIKIPAVYGQQVLGRSAALSTLLIEDDPNCLALLKHYHSLAPMSMEARKPIFLLKPADGAIGAHVQAVQRSYADFRGLAKRILEVTDETQI